MYPCRVIAAALIPLTVAPFAAGTLNPVSDAVFGALLVLHTHIGFQYAIVRPSEVDTRTNCC